MTTLDPECGRPYAVAITPQAQRQLSRLPSKIRAVVLEALYGSIAHHPWLVGKRLQDELAGLRVARRGEYRVVFRVDEAKHLVVVYRVEHPRRRLPPEVASRNVADQTKPYDQRRRQDSHLL